MAEKWPGRGVVEDGRRASRIASQTQWWDALPKFRRRLLLAGFFFWLWVVYGYTKSLNRTNGSDFSVKETQFSLTGFCAPKTGQKGAYVGFKRSVGCSASQLSLSTFVCAG